MNLRTPLDLAGAEPPRSSEPGRSGIGSRRRTGPRPHRDRARGGQPPNRRGRPVADLRPDQRRCPGRQRRRRAARHPSAALLRRLRAPGPRAEEAPAPRDPAGRGAVRHPDRASRAGPLADVCRAGAGERAHLRRNGRGECGSSSPGQEVLPDIHRRSHLGLRHDHGALQPDSAAGGRSRGGFARLAGQRVDVGGAGACRDRPVGRALDARPPSDGRAGCGGSGCGGSGCGRVGCGTGRGTAVAVATDGIRSRA
jgi:hypothetical protein